METFGVAGGSNGGCTSEAKVELGRTKKRTFDLKKPNTETCERFGEGSNPRRNLWSRKHKQSAEMMDLERTADDVDCPEDELCLNSEERIAKLERENEELKSKIEALSKLNNDLARSKAKNVKKVAALKDENLELEEKYKETALTLIEVYDYAKKIDKKFSKLCTAVKEL